jgi:hypothetical protein
MHEVDQREIRPAAGGIVANQRANQIEIGACWLRRRVQRHFEFSWIDDAPEQARILPNFADPAMRTATLVPAVRLTTMQFALAFKREAERGQ